MRDYQSLAHTKWDCKYHVVFIPKRRKKAIFGAIRKHLGEGLSRGDYLVYLPANGPIIGKRSINLIYK